MHFEEGYHRGEMALSDHNIKGCIVPICITGDADLDHLATVFSAMVLHYKVIMSFHAPVTTKYVKGNTLRLCRHTVSI